jgi:hypothetical protein
MAAKKYDRSGKDTEGEVPEGFTVEKVGKSTTILSRPVSSKTLDAMRAMASREDASGA